MPELVAVDKQGPWPFVTRRVFRLANGSLLVWSSRHHRKGLLLLTAAESERPLGKLVRHFRLAQRLNWWIGGLFAMGSLLFALASVLSLAPSLARAWALDSTAVSAIFFAGSIPFTCAAYLQLFQSANAGEFPGDDRQSAERTVFFGWRPHDVGWLSCALQFVGTVWFNINTFDAMLPALDWLQQDLAIWIPDLIGSILFLASGYLAFIETCHAHWAWNPANISWWVVFVNLLGCIGFMIAALLGFVLPGPPRTELLTLSLAFTLQGAVCFFLGAILMWPEAMSPPKSP